MSIIKRETNREIFPCISGVESQSANRQPMTVIQKNRRGFLKASFSTLGALAALPSAGLGLEITAQDWTSTLEGRLRSFSTSVTRALKGPSEIELHCTMSDPVAFGTSHGNLEGLRLKARASGNKLSLQRDGMTVHVFILTDDTIPAAFDSQASIG